MSCVIDTEYCPHIKRCVHGFSTRALGCKGKQCLDFQKTDASCPLTLDSTGNIKPVHRSDNTDESERGNSQDSFSRTLA